MGTYSGLPYLVARGRFRAPGVGVRGGRGAHPRDLGDPDINFSDIWGSSRLPLSPRLRVLDSGGPRRATITNGRPRPIRAHHTGHPPGPHPPCSRGHHSGLRRRFHDGGIPEPGLGQASGDEAVADSRPKRSGCRPVPNPCGSQDSAAPPPRRSRLPEEASAGRPRNSSSAEGWGRGGDPAQALGGRGRGARRGRGR